MCSSHHSHASGIRLVAQVEGDRNARAVSGVGKDHVRDVARKQHHQSWFWIDVNALRNDVRQEGGAPAGAGIEQMNRRTAVGIDRVSGIDIVGSRPRRCWMHVHLVEVPAAVDIDPSGDGPPTATDFLALLGGESARGLIGEPIHVFDKAPPGIAAEFELPSLGVPAAAIRLGNAAAPRLMRQDALAQ
jgi:hypothetical protein